MIHNPKKSVAIAGAGIAGLAAAVYFDELGYQVTLFERKPICGGRTFSFQDKITGATIDNGQHLMVGAYHETLALLEKIGAKHNVGFMIPSVVPIYNRHFQRAEFVLQDGWPLWSLCRAVFGFAHFSFAEKLVFWRLGWQLKRFAKNPASLPANLTAKEWLLQNGQTPNTIESFWEVLTLATLNAPTDMAQARLLAQVLVKSYFGGRRDGFLVLPKKGLSETLVEPVLQYLEQRGQTVARHVGVKAITILNNQVQHFVLNNDEKVKADHYISALPPPALQNVLPKAFVDQHASLQHLSQFKDAPIVSVNLFYDRDVLGEMFVGAAATTTHWFFNKNAICHLPGPPYHVVGVISAATDFLTKSKAEILQIATENLRRLCPKAQEAKLLHALINIERQATFLCDVQSAGRRPAQKICENFGVIGDWTNTGLPATIESAVLSAKLAASFCTTEN